MEVNILQATEIIFISSFLLSEIELIEHNGVRLQYKAQPMPELESVFHTLRSHHNWKQKCKQWGNKLH